jgi:hypothetical protein
MLNLNSFKFLSRDVFKPNPGNYPNRWNYKYTLFIYKTTCLRALPRYLRLDLYNLLKYIE